MKTLAKRKREGALRDIKKGRQNILINIKKEKKIEEEINQHCQNLLGCRAEGSSKCHFIRWT